MSTGTLSVLVRSVQLESNSNYIVSGFLNPGYLQPTEYLTIPVVYQPATNGEHRNNLLVESDADNAGDGGIHRFGLLGFGYGFEEPPIPPVRYLSLVSDTQDFAYTPVGENKDIVFRLRAGGTHSTVLLWLNLVDQNPLTNPLAFSIQSPNYPLFDGSLNGAVVLAPGELSEPFSLRFSPDREVVFYSKLTHSGTSNVTEGDLEWQFTGLGYDPSTDIPDDPPPPPPGPDPEPGPGDPPPPSNNLSPDGVGSSCVLKPCVVEFLYRLKL
jgi:hypothetical protein